MRYCAIACAPTTSNVSTCIDCSNDLYSTLIINLTSLTNIAGVYTGLNNTDVNNSFIDLTEMDIIASTTFAVFGA